MDLRTRYLGFDLPHPFMGGASPLTADLDGVRRLEDAGASAIVMHSLFEEQITRERFGTIHDMETAAERSAEALAYFPDPQDFAFGPEGYLEQVRKIKAAVRVPVIASLNGVSPHGWLDFAAGIAAAGADALELNIYHVPVQASETGQAVEQLTLEALRAVKRSVTIPVAVKLSPFFSSLPHLARSLEAAGADALVLFNRFLQPDIDIEHLEMLRTSDLSTPSQLLTRLRWLAILEGQVSVPMAVSGGIHAGIDAVKAIMAGASAVQMVSSLLLHGPAHLRVVHDQAHQWMEAHGYESLAQMRGSMSLQRSPDPSAYQRANYMRVLTGWRS